MPSRDVSMGVEKPGLGGWAVSACMALERGGGGGGGAACVTMIYDVFLSLHN